MSNQKTKPIKKKYILKNHFLLVISSESYFRQTNWKQDFSAVSSTKYMSVKETD